jgi:hypothetical protein
MLWGSLYSAFEIHAHLLLAEPILQKNKGFELPRSD